jgi:methionyl-tRNA formyltransferase
MIRALYCGTAEFAVPALDELITANDITLVGLITQPDRPAGRGLELRPSPVKQHAQQNYPDLKIFQPEKLRLEAQQILDETKPDIIIVSAYGQFIPKLMLEFPRFGCLNIHASLLPQLRGAVPIPMAILHGLEKTGVTIQLMAEKMDVGDIIGRYELALTAEENSQTLMHKLSAAGAELLMQILPKWLAGQIKPVVQDEALATYCFQSDIARDKAQILDTMPVKQVERMIRAFNPNSGAWFELKRNGQPQIVKLFRARIVSTATSSSAMVFKRKGKQLFLAFTDGELELLELQLSGKKIGTGSDYLFLAD